MVRHEIMHHKRHKTWRGQVRSSPVRQRELFPDLDTLLECLEYDSVYVEVLLIMLFSDSMRL